ncbi:MAG: 3-dehydroquinate synthase [Candidatus Korarchaeota archaeon]|nr:3-dehydroquinate synthase [Candidatus Korarchaeota archaeon]
MEIEDPISGRIVLRRGSLADLAREIERLSPQGALVLADRGIEDSWLPHVEGALYGAGVEHVVMRMGGESCKSLEWARAAWEAMANMGLGRKSATVGVGGGAVCDLAGFVASTYMRGTLLALVPTTLLAQVDASIGGKNGVNLTGKNLVGTFYRPDLVLIDPDTLSTLPREEMASGLAEVVKCGVACDPRLFSLVESVGAGLLDPSREELDLVIQRAVAAKVSVVRRDWRDLGPRMRLNLGHTVGHAIEAVSGYSIRHGHAVAIGLVAACRVAERLLGFEHAERVERLLARLGLPTGLPLPPGEVVRAALLDKKSWLGRLAMVLPEDLGSATVRRVPEEVLLEVLEGMAN